MIRKQKSRMIYVFFFIIGVLLLGCLFINEEKEDYNKSGRRIAAVVCNGGNYWQDILTGMKQAEEESESYVKYMTYRKSDVDTQMDHLKEAEYMNVDGIITVGVPDSQEMNELLKEIREKGIPVVLIDTDSAESERDYFVSANQEAVGELAARQLAAAGLSEVNVMMVTGSLDSENQKKRMEGFSKAADTFAEMKIITAIEGSEDKDILQKKMTEAFGEHSEINSIFCVESTGSMQVGAILQEQGVQDKIKVIGFDTNTSTLAYITDGTYLGTVRLEGVDIGYEAVRYLTEEQKEFQEEDKYSGSVTYINQGNQQTYGTIEESE